MKKTAAKLETSTFGAGCFWGVEEEFRQLPGVVETQVGYEGGTLAKPSYEDACTDATGHAEVVRVKFDSRKISFTTLLDKFWEVHDPTQENRQGPDVGTQYRSAIFYSDDEQREIAEKSKKLLEQGGRFGGKKIATQVVPEKTFFPAEECHQKYLMKRGLNACH